MSVKYSHLVWTQAPNIEREALLVLLALADYANDEGRSWYSQPKIAQKCRLSERGLREILHRLGERGYLHIEPGRGRGRTATYTVQIPPQPSPTLKPEPASAFPHSENRKPTPLKPESDDTKNRKLTTPKSGITQAQPTHDPSIDPSLRSVRDPARVLPLPKRIDYTPDDYHPCAGDCNTFFLPRDPTDLFCDEYRKKNRGTLTPMYPRRIK